VLAFYALTLVLSWGWAIPLAASGSVVHRGAGWPTHVPALLGPMIAALIVTAALRGRHGLRELAGRMVRWRVGLRWWLWGLASPVAYFLAGVLVVRLTNGAWPGLGGLDRYSGIPAVGVVGVWIAAVLVNGLGEETGWRGFALSRLQQRYRGLTAALLVTPMWALWHAPYFSLLDGYRGYAPVAYVGFVFGLACGSIVLTWLYNRSGASILIVAVWHATYNMVGGATAASQGTIAAVVSTAVTVQALVLVALELRAKRAGRATVIGPRADSVRTATPDSR
jgi:membrane protease YdiL (CAAX protease family)